MAQCRRHGEPLPSIGLALPALPHLSVSLSLSISLSYTIHITHYTLPVPHYSTLRSLFLSSLSYPSLREMSCLSADFDALLSLTKPYSQSQPIGVAQTQFPVLARADWAR